MTNQTGQKAKFIPKTRLEFLPFPDNIKEALYELFPGQEVGLTKLGMLKLLHGKNVSEELFSILYRHFGEVGPLAFVTQIREQKLEKLPDSEYPEALIDLFFTTWEGIETAFPGTRASFPNRSRPEHHNPPNS